MLDAKSLGSDKYDKVFISTVQQRWYGLLQKYPYLLGHRGKVVLKFRLHDNGLITQLVTEEETVGAVLELLCQKAILDSAPFPKWPPDMRQRVGVDYRDIRFRFSYE